MSATAALAVALVTRLPAANRWVASGIAPPATARLARALQPLSPRPLRSLVVALAIARRCGGTDARLSGTCWVKLLTALEALATAAAMALATAAASNG